LNQSGKEESYDILSKYLVDDRYDIESFDISLSSDSPNGVLTMHGRCKRLSQKAGKKLIIKPSFALQDSRLIGDLQEKNHTYLNGFHITDSLTINLAEYKILKIPESFSIKNEVGEFSLDFSIQGTNSVTIRKSLMLYGQKLNPDKEQILSSFIDFYKSKLNMSIIAENQD